MPGAPLRSNVSNVDILNAIRNQATSDYQRRVPDATKANVQKSIQAMWEYQPTRNEFVNALVNRIGLVIARNYTWTNPLAKFQMGMLNFGDTIEEVMVGLVQATTYDPDRDALEKELFGQERPDVQSSFHKINRQDKYKITINQDMLKRAFLADDGLSSFVAQLMAAPAKSDNWDTFLLTTSLFKEYYNNEGFFKINVPDVSATGSTTADAQAFLRRVRELTDIITFISPHYNASGMPLAANRDELELFITPEANAAIDVQALAAAFNMSSADIPSRTTVVPKEHFGITGAQAVLSTKDFFVIADTLYETRSMQNPAGLYDNFWLHHHQVVSASRFVPALLFTSTEASDVISIADTPVTSVAPIVVKDSAGTTVTDVIRGYLYDVSGSAVTTPTGGVNDAVVLLLSGQKSNFTTLSQTGTLIVGIDEDSTSLTITAMATDDNSKTATATLNVDGPKLTMWPDPNVLDDTDSDSLLEVTPKAVPVAPTSGASKNKVTIPTPTEGYNYKDGSTVVDGQTLTLAANKTITAVPLAGYEIKTGATASWGLIYTP